MPEVLDDPVVLAAQELLLRRKARKGLHDFITYLNPDYIVSNFSIECCKALDEFLDDMVAGLRPILILGAPPQHGKSEIVSRYFPAYVFGRYPDLRIGGLSYAFPLASEMNRDLQRIMLSPEYGNLFPNSRLAYSKTKNLTGEDQRRNSEQFDIPNAKGGYVSQGVGGPLTGKRLDCFVAGTKVETSHGCISIEDLHKHANSVKVLSHSGKGLEYASIKAIASSKGLGIYRVTTKSGRVFESTGDHRILTARGYVEASKLSASDVLLCCVRKGSDQDSGGYSETASSGESHVLLQSLRKQVISEIEAKQVRVLRELLSFGRTQVLQQGMSSVGSRVEASTQNTELRNVHDRLRGEIRIGKVSIVLQQGLREQSARTPDDGKCEPSIQGWQEPIENTASLRQGVQINPSYYPSEGLASVRPVRCEQYQAGSASHRRMGEQQCVIEFDNSLCEVPQCNPQSDGLIEETDQVSLVERVREEAIVYDIQIEKNANFFANGVLVHNCGIIDDPIKNSKEALSPTFKQANWNWYVSTFLTRLSKNSGQIIMATRWATDDLSGKVAEKFDRAKKLYFLAIDKDGNALVPELHPIEKLLETKSTLGDYFWSAMYQQSPKAIGGTIIKDSWVQYYLPKDLPPKFDKVIQSWDMTFKDTDGSDYVVGQVWGRLGAHAYLLDQVRERLSFTASKAALLRMTTRWPDAQRKLVEDKANGPAVIDSLKSTVAGLIPVEPDGSKVARCHAVSSYWEAGNVWLPHPDIAPWITEFVSEVTTFPAAAHDDQVDGMTQALRDIMQSKKGFFG